MSTSISSGSAVLKQQRALEIFKQGMAATPKASRKQLIQSLQSELNFNKDHATNLVHKFRRTEIV